MILQLALLAGIATPTPGDAVQILLDADRPAAKAARDIAQLTPFPVQELFWILQGDEIPAAWTPDGDRDVYLNARQQGVIESAFRQGPHDLCIEYLSALAETERGVETKATIVEVVGWMGTQHDLAVLLLAAAPESERYLAPARLRVAFGDALNDVFARHPERTEPELPWVFRNAHSGLRLEVVKLVENAPLVEPLEVLSRMLGVYEQFDVLVLQTMHVVALRPDRRATDSVRQCVRPFLDDADPACVRLACRCLGALEDVESISDLIQLLDSNDANQRAAAAYGLSVCTGLQFDENVLRWRSWFERERVWWEESADQRFRELVHGDVVVAMRALVDISEQCLDRDALAEGVAPALHRRERGVVLTCIAYLARLGSKVVVPDLVALLERPEEDVRDAAWRTLLRLTGVRLGPDPEAWETHLKLLDR